MDTLTGKRLLFVITKSNWGGAQSYVYTLAKHFRDEGALVSVALGGTGRPGSDTGVLAARLAALGIRVLTLPAIGRDISPLQELRAFRELIALIRRERPDILHLNSSKAGGLGSLAGRIARVPRIVFTAHGWAHREVRSGFARRLIWLASWATVILSHAVIVVSDCDRRTAPVIFSRRKIRVIHNGISSLPLVPRDAARNFVAPNIAGLSKLTDWIFIPAELTRNKGIDIAIHAFAGISKRLKHTALVIAGEGEEHEQLAELIGSYDLAARAFLLGFVPDVRSYFLAADLFLMPSYKEGFPMALLEAGEASLPVIASRTGGIPEIIEDGKNGLLTAPGDIDALADAMTRMLENPDEAKAFGAELKKTVTEKFSEKEMFSGTASVYLQN